MCLFLSGKKTFLRSPLWMALQVPTAQTEVHAQALAVKVESNIGHSLVFLSCLSKSNSKIEVVAGQGAGEIAKCSWTDAEYH